MGYGVLADAVMVLHFGFLLFLVAGGFLAWRWPWTAAAHVLAVGWGAAVLTVDPTCPLTAAEDWARRAGGGAGIVNEDFDEIISRIEQVLRDAAGDGVNDLHQLGQLIRRTVGKWVSDTHRRRPMIVPTVLEV